jgi:class 3 adenylate cyclase
MPSLLKRIVRKGGLRLRLIGFIVLSILVTVAFLDYFTIRLMNEVILEKTFKIAETSLERISETSLIALLERTPADRANLEEVLKKSRSLQTMGVLDISVYITVKTGDTMEFNYFAGLREKGGNTVQLEPHLAERILAAANDAIFYESFIYGPSGEEVRPAYRFVKPINYEYENKLNCLGAVVISYSRDAIFKGIGKVIMVSIVSTIIVLPIVLVFAYMLGSRFTKPILKLAGAVSAVARGNLDVDLNISTNDEIEELGNEVKQMVRGLKEKMLLQKFVSGSTISMIRQGTLRDVRLGGEHKELTIFFSDIRGFTALSEEKDAQEVVAIANFYFNLQAEIIREWQGDIDKFVGDAVMAVFGGQEGIANAINAAIAIQQAIKVANADRRAKELHTVQVGIGICHGKVVAGNIGSQDRMDFTCVGSAVNLASRLCAKARPAEILINRETYQLTGMVHDVEEIGPIVQKGFATPIELLIIRS